MRFSVDVSWEMSLPPEAEGVALAPAPAFIGAAVSIDGGGAGWLRDED